MKQHFQKIFSGLMVALFAIAPISESLAQDSSLVAVSGACSSHDGVDLDAGPDSDGSVICNDGWRDSSVLYRDMLLEEIDPYQDLDPVDDVPFEDPYEDLDPVDDVPMDDPEDEYPIDNGPIENDPNVGNYPELDSEIVDTPPDDLMDIGDEISEEDIPDINYSTADYSDVFQNGGEGMDDYWYGDCSVCEPGEDDKFMYTYGDGTVEITPNAAGIHFSFDVKAATETEAKALYASKRQALIQKISALGISAQDIVIDEASDVLSQGWVEDPEAFQEWLDEHPGVWMYNGDDSDLPPGQHALFSEGNVIVRDFSKVRTILTTLRGYEDITVDSTSFLLVGKENQKKLYEQAQQKAVDDAMKNASEAADYYKRKLGKMDTIFYPDLSKDELTEWYGTSNIDPKVACKDFNDVGFDMYMLLGDNVDWFCDVMVLETYDVQGINANTTFYGDYYCEESEDEYCEDDFGSEFEASFEECFDNGDMDQCGSELLDKYFEEFLTRVLNPPTVKYTYPLTVSFALEQ